MNTVHFTQCPICSSNAINPLVTVKDHSVSGECFVVWQCSHCTARFTQDAPDEEHIGRYYQSPDYISHTDTAKGLVNSIYQKVRKHTLEEKARMVISSSGKKGSILDFGAGTGAFLHTMKERGWEVTGIEPDAGAREQAEKLYGMELRQPEWLQQLPSQRFDVITLWHVLEHVHQLHPTMETLKTLLKPGGRIFIAVPNYQSGDHSIYKLYWAAYDVPRHLYHFTPQSMEILLQKHGLTLIEKKPMWFDSFYISLLSSKYKNGKTNWPGAVISGIRSNINALLNRNRCSSLIYQAGR